MNVNSDAGIDIGFTILPINELEGRHVAEMSSRVATGLEPAVSDFVEFATKVPP